MITGNGPGISRIESTPVSDTHFSKALSKSLISLYLTSSICKAQKNNNSQYDLSV